MRKKYIFYLIILHSVLSCVGKSEFVYKIGNHDTSGYRVVFLSELIASPEKYDSCKIETSGHFVSRFEDFAIYVSKSDSEALEKKSAVWVNFHKELNIQSEMINGESIKVKGIFNARSKGHLNQYSGTLDEVGFVISDN